MVDAHAIAHFFTLRHCSEVRPRQYCCDFSSICYEILFARASREARRKTFGKRKVFNAVCVIWIFEKFEVCEVVSQAMASLQTLNWNSPRQLLQSTQSKV